MAHCNRWRVRAVHDVSLGRPTSEIWQYVTTGLISSKVGVKFLQKRREVLLEKLKDRNL